MQRDVLIFFIKTHTLFFTAGLLAFLLFVVLCFVCSEFILVYALVFLLLLGVGGVLFFFFELTPYRGLKHLHRPGCSLVAHRLNHIDKDCMRDDICHERGKIRVCACECDVIVTRDNCACVSHDDRLRRKDGSFLFITKSVVEDFGMCETVEQCINLADWLQKSISEWERIFIHYKAENEYPGADILKQISAITSDIRSACGEDKVVVMVEGRSYPAWQKTVTDIQAFPCWITPDMVESVRAGSSFYGIYHSFSCLSFLGRILFQMGFHSLGSIAGFGKIRRLIFEIKRQGGNVVVFTVNHPVVACLYALAGADYVGTDDCERIMAWWGKSERSF